MPCFASLQSQQRPPNSLARVGRGRVRIRARAAQTGDALPGRVLVRHLPAHGRDHILNYRDNRAPERLLRAGASGRRPEAGHRRALQPQRLAHHRVHERRRRLPGGGQLPVARRFQRRAGASSRGLPGKRVRRGAGAASDAPRNSALRTVSGPGSRGRAGSAPSRPTAGCSLRAAGCRRRHRIEIVWNLADPEHGGYETERKFPHCAANEFLLQRYQATGDARYLNHVRLTLYTMHQSKTHDPEGGFFRYSSKRDWSEPHHEKLLSDHAGSAGQRPACVRADRRILFQGARRGAPGLPGPRVPRPGPAVLSRLPRLHPHHARPGHASGFGTAQDKSHVLHHRSLDVHRRQCTDRVRPAPGRQGAGPQGLRGTRPGDAAVPAGAVLGRLQRHGPLL